MQMLNSYSQLGQDLFAIEFFNKKRDLTFAEIGAFDGINLSNTYLLEKKYGWKGVCIEPIEEEFDKLKQNRSCNVIQKAVYSSSGKKLVFSVKESGMLSGIKDNIDCHKHASLKKETIVETITFNDLAKQLDLPKLIHYVSLDTEGSELEVLNGVDFNEYTFGLLNLEHNFVEPRRTQMKNLLKKNDYVYLGHNSFDDNFMHKSMLQGVYYYKNMTDKPIVITFNLETNAITVVSSYWSADSGTFVPNKLEVNFSRLGKGKLYYDHIDFGNGNIWHRSWY